MIKKLLFIWFAIIISRYSYGQSDTVVVIEATSADWNAGTLDSLDASTSILKLKTVRNFNFSFTNCGQTLYNGPSQTACTNAYVGTDLAGAVTVTGGIQGWITPQAGIYRILAAGAGHNSDPLIRGAILQADFELAKADSLKILVGQMGGSPRGGDGGTFVTHVDNTPIIVAGGAAGMRSFVDANNLGNTTTSGSPGCAAAGGTNGSGGVALGGGTCSGAGAGLLGDGQGCGGGKAFVNGGTGGGPTTSYPGGFGGGGGVNSSSSPGAGGGYSGGGVQYTGGGSSCAGGGGSYLDSNAWNVATSDGMYNKLSTFNGENIQSLNNYRIGQGSVVMNATQYVLQGTRVSPDYDISWNALYAGSEVRWVAKNFNGTSLVVESRYSTDAGVTWSGWSTLTNGAPIGGLTAGTSLVNVHVQTRMTLSTTALFASPLVDSLIITIFRDNVAGCVKNIMASSSAGGSISDSGTVVINCGDSATFTITPDPCYAITDVLVDGISQGAISSYTFANVGFTHSIHADFAPTLQLSVRDTAFCADVTGNLTLQANVTPAGNYNYSWTGPGGFTSTSANPVITIPTATSVYSVTVNDTSGCVINKTITVTINPVPSVVITMGNDTLYAPCSGNCSYQWYKDSVGTCTDTSYCVSTGNGTYFVVVTNSSGCSFVSVPFVITGAGEIFHDSNIRLYPNPSTGQMIISSGKILRDAHLTVVNTLGETVLSDSFSGNEKILDLKSDSGVYFLKIESEEGQWMQKIIIR